VNKDSELVCYFGVLPLIKCYLLICRCLATKQERCNCEEGYPLGITLECISSKCNSWM